MLGIVIVTHGALCEGLKSALEVIIGDTSNIATVSLQAQDDVNNLSEKIISAINEIDNEDGVVIACDVMCASPYNQALISKHKINKDNIKIITGVNLPMLMELVNQQFVSADIDEAIVKSVESGKQGIDFYQESNISNEEDEF